MHPWRDVFAGCARITRPGIAGVKLSGPWWPLQSPEKDIQLRDDAFDRQRLDVASVRVSADEIAHQ